MLESLAIGLGIALAALAALLAILAGLATRRFGERRFLLFGLAFSIVAVVAVFALVAELGWLGVVWFDETFALEPAPTALLIVALLLVYTAMASRRRPAGDGHAGGA